MGGGKDFLRNKITPPLPRSRDLPPLPRWAGGLKKKAVDLKRNSVANCVEV